MELYLYSPYIPSWCGWNITFICIIPYSWVNGHQYFRTYSPSHEEHTGDLFDSESIVRQELVRLGIMVNQHNHWADLP